jgi:hypothetical protein
MGMIAIHAALKLDWQRRSRRQRRWRTLRHGKRGRKYRDHSNKWEIHLGSSAGGSGDSLSESRNRLTPD